MSGNLLDNSDQLDNTGYLEYASFKGRVLAAFIDVFIIGGLKIGLLALNLFFLQNIIVQYLKIIIYPFYKIYLEGTTGQTLGKRWVGIRVVKLDDRNNNMDIWSSIIRYTVYLPYLVLELLTVYYTFDLVAITTVEVENILKTYHGFKKNEPGFLLLLKGGSILFILMSTLHIFKEKKKQALHDILSETVCIKVRSKV
jgi:uncharacterized RDD family membrane protein YckC